MELLASVVIRSKDRVPELARLVTICRAQTYRPLEIVVVDSTEGVSDAELAAALAPAPGAPGAHDTTLTIIRQPARGCAAAANEGVRRARGDVVVFVDDDDLPIGDGWLAAHMANFADPRCLGVNGRMRYEGVVLGAQPQAAGKRAAQNVLSFGFWKNPRWLAPLDERRLGIQFLMGGNASLRKSAWELGGGWDEFLPYHNECSLFLRLAAAKRPGEYLVYDPTPEMLIRRDIPGGVGQRDDKNIQRFVDTLAKYYLWTVAPAHPARIYGLFPLFALRFVRTTAGDAASFMRQQPGGAAQAGWAYRRALAYAPVSLAKHLLRRGA